jgi:hypothetical protein
MYYKKINLVQIFFGNFKIVDVKKFMNYRFYLMDYNLKLIQ